VNFKNIFQFETSASSIAHAAEVRAERRFRAGLGFVASYRFSRSIDDATLISILPQDSHNLRAERGLSDFHMKHRLIFSGTYSLPARRFLSGWQLHTVGTLQSGTPLSAIIGEDVSGTGSPIGDHRARHLEYRCRAHPQYPNFRRHACTVPRGFL
jgi:hypothetical protein